MLYCLRTWSIWLVWRLLLERCLSLARRLLFPKTNEIYITWKHQPSLTKPVTTTTIRLKFDLLSTYPLVCYFFVLFDGVSEIIRVHKLFCCFGVITHRTVMQLITSALHKAYIIKACCCCWWWCVIIIINLLQSAAGHRPLSNHRIRSAAFRNQSL